MDKNLDPKIIVLDRDMFDKLLYLAEAGERDMGGSRLGKIHRHAARFNQHYGDQEREIKAEEARSLRSLHKEAKALVKRVQNKVVFIEREVRTSGGYEKHLVPVTLHGLPKFDLGWVYYKKPGTLDKDIVRPSGIIEKLPPNYCLIEFGPHKGNYGPVGDVN